MITEKELKEIYSIIDEFGADKKVILLNRLKSLLKRKEIDAKKEMFNQHLSTLQIKFKRAKNTNYECK